MEFLEFLGIYGILEFVEFSEFLDFLEFSEFLECLEFSECVEFLEFLELGDGVFSFGSFGIETVTEAVVFWNTLILWNFVIFGAEPLLNVLKTTMKGRSPGGVPYI